MTANWTCTDGPNRRPPDRDVCHQIPIVDDCHVSSFLSKLGRIALMFEQYSLRRSKCEHVSERVPSICSTTDKFFVPPHMADVTTTQPPDVEQMFDSERDGD